MRVSRAVAALFALIVSIPTAASAATMVLGGGQAHDCYLEADRGRASDFGLGVCTSALEGDPLSLSDRAATFVNRGVIYLQRRDGRNALADLDSALRIAPALAEAYVNRGAALVLLDRVEEAEATLTKGISLNPKEPQEAYFNRAIAREIRGDLKGAYQDYVEAQRLKPDWRLPTAELARFTVSRPGS